MSDSSSYSKRKQANPSRVGIDGDESRRNLEHVELKSSSYDAIDKNSRINASASQNQTLHFTTECH